MFARLNVYLMLRDRFVFAGCLSASNGQEVSVDGGSYRVVSVQESQTMLEDKEFTMINVHTPW